MNSSTTCQHSSCGSGDHFFPSVQVHSSPIQGLHCIAVNKTAAYGRMHEFSMWQAQGPSGPLSCKWRMFWTEIMCESCLPVVFFLDGGVAGSLWSCDRWPVNRPRRPPHTGHDLRSAGGGKDGRVDGCPHPAGSINGCVDGKHHSLLSRRLKLVVLLTSCAPLRHGAIGFDVSHGGYRSKGHEGLAARAYFGCRWSWGQHRWRLGGTTPAVARPV